MAASTSTPLTVFFSGSAGVASASANAGISAQISKNASTFFII